MTLNERGFAVSKLENDRERKRPGLGERRARELPTEHTKGTKEEQATKDTKKHKVPESSLTKSFPFSDSLGPLW